MTSNPPPTSFTPAPTIKVTPPSPPTNKITDPNTANPDVRPSTLDLLLEKHRKWAKDETMAQSLSYELWLAQGGLPPNEVTPTLIRCRIADHAALAHAEGKRHAEDVLESEQENSASIMHHTEEAMGRLKRSCSARWEGFMTDIKRGQREKETSRNSRSNGRPEKIPLKSALKKPGEKRPDKSVAFLDPLFAVPEGTGKFIVMLTSTLDPPDENDTYIQYLREPTPVELELANRIGADKVGIVEFALKDIREKPNGKCVRPKKEAGQGTWKTMEAKERLALGWGTEEMLQTAEMEERERMERRIQRYWRSAS
ncbi:hypothetical protein EDC01DRAFT_780816 [Geopyxis carbonaria]|nr:hypothetical protein EDC01DRAFT_780816 [Geopyxis carbonaria]